MITSQIQKSWNSLNGSPYIEGERETDIFVIGPAAINRKSEVTGKNQGINLVFTIDVISCQIQDRYSGKIKKQRIGWRLRQIGKAWNLVQVQNPSVLTRRGGRAMTPVEEREEVGSR